MERVVICMKWGKLYGPDYVNVLYHATCAHLPKPFRFVCLTDDAVGLDVGIETYPVPEFGLRQDLWFIGGWPKVGLFKRDLYGLTGRALFIDLDMVILGDLMPFFEHPGEIIATDMGAQWRRRPGKGPKEFGTCLFAYDLGQQPQIYDEFVSNQTTHAHKFGLEQNYVGAFASSQTFWPENWVISFKRHLRRPALIGAVLPVPPPPAGAKILAFHGKPRPKDLIGHGWWGEFPHVGRGPVGWLRDYWLSYGGGCTSKP